MCTNFRSEPEYSKKLWNEKFDGDVLKPIYNKLNILTNILLIPQQ